jgi:hypothetical protein
MKIAKMYEEHTHTDIIQASGSLWKKESTLSCRGSSGKENRFVARQA